MFGNGALFSLGNYKIFQMGIILLSRLLRKTLTMSKKNECLHRKVVIVTEMIKTTVNGADELKEKRKFVECRGCKNELNIAEITGETRILEAKLKKA